MPALNALPVRTRATAPVGSPSSRRWAHARHAAAELTPQAIEQIAQRVAELIHARAQAEPNAAPTTQGRLLNAAQLAARLGTTRAWVYEHANELGAITLRFDPDAAAQALRARGRGLPERDNRSRRPQQMPRVRPHPSIPLLPIHEPRARGILSRYTTTRRNRY
jgi:hypothetical protein